MINTSKFESHAKSSKSAVSVLVLLYIVLVILAVIVGAAIGFGFYTLVASLALIIPSIYFLFRPDIGLVLFAVLTLLVSGSLKYFFNLNQFQWALSALGFGLLVYALIYQLFTKNKNAKKPMSGIGVVLILWWIGLFFSSATGDLAVLDWLVGLRIYLPVFGIFAYVAYCNPNEQLLKKVIYFMFGIATIQWIFCLYQKLEIVPIRIASHYKGSAWDSIVGTFGGDKFGGGESGSLGVYLAIVFILVLALKKFNQIRNLTLIVILVSALVAMVLVESKVIALLIPLGVFLVYRDYIFKHPMKFLLGAIILILIMLGILVAYYYLYWKTESKLALVDDLYKRLTYSFDPYFQASSTNLGRTKSLLYWWNQQSLLDNPLTFLFGYGLSSAVSSSSMIGEGASVHQHGYMLDVTGVSKLLWESGLVGTLLFIMSFIFGFFRANHLKRDNNLPEWHRALMTGVETAMLLIPLTIFYEVTAVASPPMQFMAMFLLGYVVYWWRESAGVEP